MSNHQERINELYNKHFQGLNFYSTPYYVRKQAGKVYGDVVKLNLEYGFIDSDKFDPTAIYYIALWLKSNVFNKYIQELDVEELAASISKQILEYYETRIPRVFYITPLQGDMTGSQEEQRVYKEYSERLEVIEHVAEKFGFAVIRIDKASPISNLVDEIRSEIQKANFIIADLTDERPSCYFEAGYADALGKPIIYIASRDSVLKPGTGTKIHFDIHYNIQYFKSHEELYDKLLYTIEKNGEITKTEL